MSTSIISFNRVHIRNIGYPVEILESTGRDIFYILNRVKHPHGILATENMSSKIGYTIEGRKLQLFNGTDLICVIEILANTINVSGSSPNLTKILHEIATHYIFQRPT